MNYHYTIEQTRDGAYKATVQNPRNGRIIVAVSGPLLRGVVQWVREQQRLRGDPVVGVEPTTSEVQHGTG